MFTYEMSIVNQDNCKKIIYESGDSFMDAVSKMRIDYGKEWVVYSHTIVGVS